jgi:hypothetical protein
MVGEPEGGVARGLGVEEGRGVEVDVFLRPGPDGRYGRDMGQVQGVDQGAPDIGVHLAGERPQPGLHRVDLLDAGHKAVLVDHGRRGRQLGVGRLGVFVPHHHGARIIAVADHIGRHFLGRAVRVHGLVDRIRVLQAAFLPGDDLL